MDHLRAEYQRRKQFLVSSLERKKYLALILVFFSLVVAFTGQTLSPYVFMSAIAVLVLQIFASQTSYQLLQTARAERALAYGIRTIHSPTSKADGAALAVYNGFFWVFLCFDVVWLSSCYMNPTPAGSFSLFLERLHIGPISGIGFLIFTFFFWIAYTSLYLVGSYLRTEIDDDTPTAIARFPFSILVKNFKGETIQIDGLRMPNPGKQPLILWPGFYQNAFFYDLIPGKLSLAEYLWQSGYDLWLFHPRGEHYSDWAQRSNALDDYAAEDIPAIISFVYKNTATKPILVGHSQGGISSLSSLMGTSKSADGRVYLSDEASRERQSLLAGLVTLGSFLDFTFSKHSALQDFVKKGLRIGNVKIVSSQSILRVVGMFNRIPVPVPFALREAMMNSAALRWLLFPLTGLLHLVALLGVWEFLYHIPNVSRSPRIHLLYRTMQSTFSGILSQFHGAILNGKMTSLDHTVNYSENYHRISVPISVVTMEYDTLADPVETEKNMFGNLASVQKTFTVWNGQGHEDFVMNKEYFHQVTDAINAICPTPTHPS